MEYMVMKKVALVTGAGSGIGQHSALALVAAGYHVVLVGRREDRLRDVASQADPSMTSVQPKDVADPEAVVGLFAEVAQSHGRLDVLFNNAGTGAPPVNLEDVTLSQWQNVVNVNLTAAFLCTQQAFKLMKQQDPQGGRIINNGSISAHTPRPNSAPYTATKHAITGLTKSTSLDGRAYNIACSQIDIGNALTEMTGRMAQGVPQADGTVRAEPTMDVKHVADAVVQIAAMPLDANVQFMTIMATTMPYIGRG
jgi:NAD(P)-dependent dehydrogenase (short-subunit alcohol dehydrogenase family)